MSENQFKNHFIYNTLYLMLSIKIMLIFVLSRDYEQREIIMAASDSKCFVLNNQFEIINTEDGKQVAVCTICNKRFQYHHSTSSLKYHLQNKHLFTGNQRSDNKGQCSMLKYVRPTTTSKEVQLEITKALCHWVCASMRPISIIEDSGLQRAFQVATNNTEFTLPGRTSFTEKINDLYNAKAKEIQEKLNKADQVVLAVDYWTSASNHAFLGVTGFFVNEDYQLENVTLGVDYTAETHTSEHIQDQIKAFMEKWNINEKVKHIISDNAANITKAIRLLQMFHIPCMAHTIQLSINHGIAEFGASNSLSKCRKIVGHFKHSPPKMAQFKQMQADDKQSTLSLVSSANKMIFISW